MVLVFVLLGVGVLAARGLVTPLYLNLGYLELVRRTPAFARARDFFDFAAVGAPQAPGVARAYGALALAEGDGSSAYSFLQRAAASEPVDVLTHWQMGRALDAMGKETEAADEYRLAGASVYFSNAALYARHQKDWRAAEHNFLKAIEIAPDDPTLARTVFKFYREWGKPDRAKLYLERALEDERRGYERALLRGELADLQQDPAGAERAFRDAIRQMPAQPEAYRLLAESYVGLGDLAEAITVLETGARNATPAYELNLRLAQLLLVNKDWSAAASALVLAQLEQKNSDEVYLVIAQLELGRDKPAAAVDALEHALTLAPYNAETHFWLGRALAQTDQCEAARRAYADALALAPDDVRFAPAQQVWGACE